MLLEPVERFALQKIYEAVGKFGVPVLEQLDRAQVVKRDLTGVGFFTSVLLPSRLPSTTPTYAEWNFCHQQLAYGGSFMCWLDDQQLLELEAVALDEAWPDCFQPDHFSDIR